MGLISFDHTRPLDVVFLGRIAIDFNPAYSELVQEEFKPLKDVHYFEKFVGGSPANMAVGVTRHGLRAGFIGKVSDDQFGDFVIEYFEREGIDTSEVTRSIGGENLGLTFTEMRSSTESSLLMYRNGIADLQLSVDDVHETYIAQAKLLVISGTALAESPSREAVLKAALLARKTNTPLLFDIDYRAYTWKHTDDIAIYYAALARQADIIMGSREEFDLAEALICSGMTDEESACYWHKHHARIVLIKHGMKGSSAFLSSGDSYSIQAFPVKARKGFGGGDGYGAGFIYGLFQDWSIARCLEFGSAEASMMVRANNCSDALPNLEAVEEFITEAKVHGNRSAERVS
ncbi:5-dehydro-2-deoxygluconokinase [Collinsella sp. zg1085]|uniref:5-dehydro-2-deoxygluconokinase n=1 Tax=Collinsella sp. zg1085 TaxID=2844380 RepID=UPI001C0B5353|nr:5-dehydro-2-deoxygluconokinase [Collinsella sp. zg1085]QWT17416.1 5-dehydro-2-deoxygluconokinase [Collinsella sp. zg1085]